MNELFEPPRRPTMRADPDVAERLRRPASHGAEPLRVAVASVVMLLVIASLMKLTDIRSDLAARVASPLADKIANADRVSYYLLPPDHERGPSFRLRSDDISIKLITHLVLPPGHVFDPDDDFAYGVRLSLESYEGEELWRHEVNIRTRQSKKELTRYGWRFENAFVLEDADGELLLDPSAAPSDASVLQLGDDRLTRVRLPEGERDRRLRISFVPREPSVGARGLARIYARRPRPVDERRLKQLSQAPDVARDLVDHLTFRDWDQLSELERRQKLEWVWTRLAAEGTAGVDYEIMSIFETGYRLPRGTKIDDPPLLVDPFRSLAINVLGPTELRVDGVADPARMAGLQIFDRRLDGISQPLPSSRARSRELILDEGVHTLVFTSEYPLELAVQVAEANDERHWLIEGERPRRFNDDGSEVLEPDMRRIQVINVGDQWTVAPRWTIEGPLDPSTRVLRFDFRVIHPDPWRWWLPGEVEAPPIPAVEMCFYDAEGAELDCHDWAGQPARESHFEGLKVADPLNPDAPGQARETRWYAASEPQSMRVVAPRGTAFVEIHDDDDPERAATHLAVRAYGYWPEVETVVGLPFREYTSEEMIWRYPPLDTRTWFPMRPSNYDDLQDVKAIADFYAQVRLQPRGPGSGGGRWGSDGDGDPDARRADELLGEDGWDPGPWLTLQPRGVHRRRSILERLDDEAAQRLADRWAGSLFTELEPGRELAVDFGAFGPAAPELHWDVEAEALGAAIELDIDGQVYRHRVEETRGRWRLPVSEGRGQLRLGFDAASDDFDTWIDRPVLDDSLPVSRRRTVHELTEVPDSLVFPLIKRGPEALTVNLVVYVPRRCESAELALSVDGGRPIRREGVPLERLSRADRTYNIDAEAAYDEQERAQGPRAGVRYVDLDTREQRQLDVVTVQITLGEDVVKGTHEVTVRLFNVEDIDQGARCRRVWVRAFHRGVPSEAKPAASWTETTDERIDESGDGQGQGAP